jgi:TPR repeat protein
MIRLLLVLIAFVLLGWATVLFVSGDDAATRTRKAEDAARFEALVPMAEGGDAQAQYTLGQFYQQGRGVARDAKAAAEWYVKAVSKGHAAARYELGKLHEKGEGVKQDYYMASGGSGWPPTSATMPRPSSPSANFILMAAAFRTTTARRLNGT